MKISPSNKTLAGLREAIDVLLQHRPELANAPVRVVATDDVREMGGAFVQIAAGTDTVYILGKTK